MICPKCGGDHNCPCLACVVKNKGKVVWRWVGVNGPISCGHCGHTMSVGEWSDEEWRQYKQEGEG